ncbi:Bug family tripartite tricarboxylate transporter substrate binding protein [Devosia sp. A369]
MKFQFRRVARVAALAAIASQAAVGAGFAADYPAGTINVVVPFPAGGAVDNVARLVINHIEEPFRSQMVVNNIVGASGMVGEAEVARSKPDGLTVLFDALTIAVTPSIRKEMTYDPEAITPVAMLTKLPFIVVNSPDDETANAQELIELARASADGLTAAYAGVSTLMGMHLFSQAAGAPVYPVAYNGGPEVSTAIMRQEVDVAVNDITSASELVASGKVRGLVVSGTERVPLLPDVPTALELGITGFEPTTWFAVFAPSGTDPELLEQLNAAINKTVEIPAVVEQLARWGARPDPMSVAEFTTFFADQRELWKNLIETAAIPLL